MSPTRRSPDLGEIHLMAGPDYFDDCPEQWLGFGSVEEEILRGAGLRLHKPDYRITCDNIADEMAIATGFEKKKKKKYSKRSDAVQTTPCTPRPCSPLLCCKSPTVMCVGSAGSSSSYTHHYWSRKCPLRIAELAQPKKRQCIENIKDNAHRLPPIMLERLRQRVNDDRPLAEIPDAINCFKIRRPPRRPKSVNEWKSICNSIHMENLKRMDTRNLCVLFGHGIVTKLAVPMIITLNSEFDGLSAIVESDISKVMRCKKLNSYTDDRDCEKIRKEIADKVTAWIATVLEESKNRLVDEDVKERRSQSTDITGKAGGEDVDTVIRNQRYVSLNTSQAEMEEEIGPVLDFVDDLVNTVMGSVAKDDEDTDSYTEALGSDNGGTTRSKYDTADSEDDSEDTATTKRLSNTNDFFSITPPIDKENVEKDIEYNDDSANSLNGQDTDGAPVDTTTDTGSAPEHTEAEINAEPDHEVKEYKNVGAEVTSSGFVNNEEGQSNKKQAKNSISDKQIVGILQKEDSMDDKNKTVKFSNVDMVKELIREPNESTITFTNLLEYKYLPPKKHSIYDSYPLDSELGPLNENLLSEADELWPDDVTTTGMTISENITQSITSLGKIVESDQEFSNDHEDSKKHSTEKTMVITDLNTLNGSNNNFIYDENKNENLEKNGYDNTIKDVGNKYEYLHRAESDNKYDDNRSEKSQTDGFNDTVKTDDNNENEKSYEEVQQKIKLIETLVLQRNEAKNAQVVELTSEEIVKENENTAQQRDLEGFEKCQGDYKDVNRKKPQTQESQLHHTPDKFKYRVNLETAPAWARIPLLTAEDSSICITDVNKYKNEINDLEIKKWCKDLESAYEGLEQWSLWIKAACEEVIELKEKFQGIKKPCPQHYCQKRAKEWRRLKRDIDKDTILWSKLYQRAHGTLKAYTEKQKQKINSTEQWLACTCQNTSKR